MEAQVAAQAAGLEVQALVLLDAVGFADGGGRPTGTPPTRSLRMIRGCFPPPVLCLRAEPASLNNNANILHVLEEWKQTSCPNASSSDCNFGDDALTMRTANPGERPRLLDVRILNATHIDPIGPISCLLRCLLGWDEIRHGVFTQMVDIFLSMIFLKNRSLLQPFKIRSSHSDTLIVDARDWDDQRTSDFTNYCQQRLGDASL